MKNIKNDEKYSFYRLTKDDIIYRRWDIKYFNSKGKVSFRNDQPYWFTTKKYIKGINIPGSTRAYSPKKHIDLFDISNKNNIKKLLKSDIPIKIKEMIQKLTGIGLTQLNNNFCGYTNKLPNQLIWCSAPEQKDIPSSGIDGIIVKFVAKYFNCDGYIVKNAHHIRNKKILKYQTEFAIINPQRKLNVLYGDKQPN